MYQVPQARDSLSPNANRLADGILRRRESHPDATVRQLERAVQLAPAAAEAHFALAQALDPVGRSTDALAKHSALTRR
jgi:Flp pilus assembly protein TadD